MTGVFIKNPEDLPKLLIDYEPGHGQKGGPGSGNFGHAGRPGAVGGSQPRGHGVGRRVVPARTRVGAAMQWAPGNAPTGELRRQVETSLDLIDWVHGDGGLPRIYLGSDDREELGTFVNNIQTAQAVLINVSTKSDHPLETTIHEVGHFIDFHLGTQRRIGKRSGGAAGEAYAAVFDALGQTKAVNELWEMYQHPSQYAATHATEGDSQHPFKPDRVYTHYLLEDTEQFARAYSQYIATRSQHPQLQAEIASELRVPAVYELRSRYGDQRVVVPEISYPEHWEADDFAPVAAAFDKLFEELHWRERRRRR
jgi:hypothetical protein